MRFVIDTEADKKRIIDKIVATPLDKLLLQASVDDNWELQFYLIVFLGDNEGRISNPKP